MSLGFRIFKLIPLNLFDKKGKCRDQDNQDKQMHQYQYPDAEVTFYQVIKYGIIFLHFLYKDTYLLRLKGELKFGFLLIFIK